MNEPNAPKALSSQVNRSKIASMGLQGSCAGNFSSVLRGFMKVGGVAKAC